MKHLILTFVFTAFLGTFGVAQHKIEKPGNSTYPTKEEIQKFEQALEVGATTFYQSIPFSSNNSKKTAKSIELEVIGKSNMQSITKEGHNLLNQAYELKLKGVSDKTASKELKEEYGKAILYVLKQEQKGISTSEAEIKLFGGNVKTLAQNNSNPLILDNGIDFLDAFYTSDLLRCRWYQIRCHLSSIFGEDAADAIIDAFVGWLESLF